jgi:hypothetical protein
VDSDNRGVEQTKYTVLMRDELSLQVELKSWGHHHLNVCSFYSTDTLKPIRTGCGFVKG